jgi:hypothetical protein
MGQRHASFRVSTGISAYMVTLPAASLLRGILSVILNGWMK